MIIYKITNLINNKIYVGQTTNSIKERWKSHKKSKYKSLIKSAIDKYGQVNFLIEIIDHAQSLEELDKKEIYWISNLQTIAPKGYNLTTGGQFKKTLSKIGRDNISRAQKKRFKTQIHPRTGSIGKLNSRSKEVLCLNTGEIFESCRQAALKLGLLRSHVNEIARGKGTRYSTKRYRFIYI